MVVKKVGKNRHKRLRVSYICHRSYVYLLGFQTCSTQPGLIWTETVDPTKDHRDAIDNVISPNKMHIARGSSAGITRL